MNHRNNKMRASQESIDDLCNTAKTSFGVSFLLLSNSIATYNKLNYVIASNDTDTEILSFWKVLLKLNIYNLFVSLDINTIFRANFRSQTSAEKISNIKYINVITLEAYRYMFGSKKDKLNAVWNEIVDEVNKFAIKHSNTELITDLDLIKSKADTFKQVYATRKDGDNRNFAIHYDMKPFKVWEYLYKTVDEDYECKRVAAFLSYIESIQIFINKYMRKYNIPLSCIKANVNMTAKDILSTFVDNEDRLYNTSGSALITYASTVNSMVHRYKKMTAALKLIIEKANITIDTFPDEQLEIIYPGIHIAFIYIDLATASRAYLKSEHYVERILNLRRINVVVYEGFKKLYGFNEYQKNNSFWKKHICSILDNINDEVLKAEINSIEDKLKMVAQDPVINNFDLREFSVHYRYEGNDNLIPLYNELLKFNQLSEFKKAKLILDILPTLIEMTTKAMSHKNTEDSAKIARQFNDMILKFNSTMDALLNQPLCPPEYRGKFIDAKDKFKAIINKFE